jgi:hypothetical protein
MDWIDGYSHRSVHPRHLHQVTGVDDAGAALIDPSGGALGASATRIPKFLWIELFNADANPVTVLLTHFGEVTEWMRVRLLTNTNIIIPGWDTHGLGLEAFAAAAIASNGFGVTIAYSDGSTDHS